MRWLVCTSLALLLWLANVKSDEPEYINTDGSSSQEFEYIETPEIESREEEEEESVDYVKQNISMVIHSPPDGAQFTEDTVVVRFEVFNASKASGFSAMAYFGGGGNPFPVDLEHTDISIVINDLQFGGHSVRILLLNSRREPTGIEAGVRFERLLPPNATAPASSISRPPRRGPRPALRVAASFRRRSPRPAPGRPAHAAPA